MPNYTIINSKPKTTRILTDIEEEREDNLVNPREDFNFKKYSEALTEIIIASEPRYSIGIYGEWGFGKTTLMKLIENQLKSETNKTAIRINWKNIFTDTDTKSLKILKNYLVERYGEQIEWINKDIQLIKAYDKKSIEIKSKKDNAQSVSITLNEETPGDIDSIKNASLYIKPNNTSFDFWAGWENNDLIVKTSKILTVWFNAWRYENEENFALIPLLKTIAYAMTDYPDFQGLREKLIRGLAIIGKDFLRHYALQYAMTQKGIDEFEGHIHQKFANSVEFERDTIYFDGMIKIKEEMKNIKTHSDVRIVVFIDDLDRCSPEHALEVFESIKVFLDMPGFVFVLGLSREALYKLIEAKFQQIGISGLTGEQYIRKIIQIEVQIPEWKENAIVKLIDNIASNLEKEQSGLIQEKENIDLIKMVVKNNNPREVKRFINKLIVMDLSNDLSNRQEDLTQYLIVEAFRLKWKNFYEYYFENKEFRSMVYEEWKKKNIDEKKIHLDDIIKKSQNNQSLEKIPFAKVLNELRSEFLDPELWKFLDLHQKYLEDISNIIKFKDISEVSNIKINTPSPAADINLLSKRRKSYEDLWPRFKLLFSEYQATEKQYKGRTYLNSYQDIREFSEKLQNWYYDMTGGLWMTDRSKDAYNNLRRNIQIVLATRIQSKQNETDPMPEDDLKSIKEMIYHLQESLNKDIGLK